MIIDGKLIALEIKKSLLKEVPKLQNKHITPQLAIVFCDTDDSIRTYIRQKQKFGADLGIKVKLIKFGKSASGQSIINRLNKLNKDPEIHGIIIQRPFPLSIPETVLKTLVNPQKDVDGFHPKSSCEAPIALSVIKILQQVHQQLGKENESPGGKPRAINCHSERNEVESRNLPANESKRSLHALTLGRDDALMQQAARNYWLRPVSLRKIKFDDWLSEKKILVIGRGESGGAPVAEYFHKYGISFLQAHSQTKNIDGLISESDIIISCVGKPNIVRHDIVKSTTILIGIGLYRKNGKLQTDYNQEKIANRVAFYTPAPGGVGPVNVAYLFNNLIRVVKLSVSS
ncbi:hypothetical protein A3D03_06125 [Candidatus Gottesmanbacteria bacterium RIFCSPHIGHO2_02_FULL_40_13]|uniref:Methenyltetrahydrofolate cyclohydrolase n=1 Tax=Candidatus Gottesmanbacteria bacterium RIFCSPHIGHO2_02_FULL_40_13 TaxID=1798384 RepID=A0A1F6A762_9BACT|nr:MAG: hypothetical protein A3D03_06125 [Candidatus Gottesmanbacteria bacterium RIFCSPHIGHO2_02_FULL_40_13]